VSAEGLRTLVGQLAEEARFTAEMWMMDREPTADDLVDDIPAIVRVYADSAALLAADFYMALDADSPFAAEPADVLSEQRIQDTIDWVLKDGAHQAPEHRLKAAMHALVFDAARDTVTANALREKVLVAREEEDGACGECMQKASLIPAPTESVDWSRHQGCEFLFVPARKGQWNPPEHLDDWTLRIAEARLAGNSSAEAIAKWLDAN
jgi:hypothetical protein